MSNPSVSHPECDPMPPSHAPLIFIFDQLRSRSHLFHRFLSTHPALEPLWHPFIKAAYFGPERHIQYARNGSARTQEVMVDMLPYYGTDTYESCGRVLEKVVEAVEAEGEGRGLLANEHGVNVLKPDLMFKLSRGEPYTPVPDNPTVISDQLYATLTPIIVIRHPLHQLRSSYTTAIRGTAMRPGDEDFSNSTTLAFSRFLFNDFSAKGRKPLVVDGDDVLWRTLEVAEGVCGALGLDAEGVKDTWGQIKDGEYGSGEPVIKAYLAEVLGSTGVVREGDEPEGPDMATEVGKWGDQFGPEVAEQLQEIAKRVMPDYEYLRQFKV